MKQTKRLVMMIFTLLDTIENQQNQPTVNKIRGLIYELLDQTEK